MNKLNDKKKYHLLLAGAFGWGIPMAITFTIIYWEDLNLQRNILLITLIWLGCIGTGVFFGIGMIIYSKVYYKLRKQNLAIDPVIQAPSEQPSVKKEGL
jgi:hypothetical protein